MLVVFFVFQAEDGIRDLVRSRGLGDVYKRQSATSSVMRMPWEYLASWPLALSCSLTCGRKPCTSCLLYTSDAADERSSVDLGGRRIIKKKITHDHSDVTR